MNISEDNMESITPVVIGILDNWRLDSQQILTLLGLTENVPVRNLRKYRKETGVLPYSADLAERIEHIFGIADAMRTSYPFNSEICASWLRRPHRRFAKNTPLHILLTEGCDGLSRIRIELDCAYGWSVMPRNEDS